MTVPSNARRHHRRGGPWLFVRPGILPGICRAFFGGVIPLSLEFKSRLILPLFYGVGTAAPVIGFAVIIAYSARIAGLFLKKD
jgi:hypothetical protein